MNDHSALETVALIEQLKAYWLQNGINPRPGVPLSSVRSFEARYSVRMPSELWYFYTSIDGMEGGTMDPDMFSFLPLTLVRPVSEELAHFGGSPDYREIVTSLAEAHLWFVIVDYLITSAVYAIRLSGTDKPAPVCWIGDGLNHRIVATSFSSFLRAYLENPQGLM